MATMTRLLAVIFAVFVLAAVPANVRANANFIPLDGSHRHWHPSAFAALPPRLHGPSGDNPKPNVPAHLAGRPFSLYMRVKDKIVEAPPELLKLAQSYPSFADKGKTSKGRRITIMAEKKVYKVGEPVRIVHVLEATDPGLEVYAMGPKPVHDEFIDGKNVCPRPADAASIYDGVVLRGPAVDFHYDITSHVFAQPGKHTIQWKGGGHPIEGKLGLESNVLTINVMK
jgi:hypothetical protein